MIDKMGYNFRDWFLYTGVFSLIILVIHEPWLRVLGMGGFLATRMLYGYLQYGALDVPILSSALGLGAMAMLMWLHPGLPFFIFAVIAFIGFVGAPIYLVIKRSHRE